MEYVDSEDNLFCDANESDSTTSDEDATPKTKRVRRIKENKSRKLLCPREGCKAAFKTEFYLKGHLRKHDGGNVSISCYVSYIGKPRIINLGSFL